MQIFSTLVAGALVCAAVTRAYAAPLELKDGDRVILLGSTLVEREQSTGYWEAALTMRFPDRNIVIRNLGWSGDNVWAEARAGFGTPADGFRELDEHVAALQPTVILVCYGANESFAGQAGVERFTDGLKTLLDTLATTKARLVLVSPTPQERVGPLFPDPAPHNRDLALYRDAIVHVAAERKLPFVDLYAALTGPDRPAGMLTDNGLHLTPYGYWATAELLSKALGGSATPNRLDIPTTGKAAVVERLPAPPAPAGAGDEAQPAPFAARVGIKGLSPGRYLLKIDGQVVATADARDWEAGQVIRSGPDVDQVEQLRQAIVAKNQLYFYRWRPQNVTYLTGFRKHEQGQNAKEVVEFDPLIAAEEAKISRLRAPVARHYEIVRESENAQ